jgi:hypothetical protein
MQIYRINVDNLEDFAAQEPDITFNYILAEWQKETTCYTLMKRTGQIESDESLRFMIARNTMRPKGYGALYRKNGRNYVWRSGGRTAHVPQPVIQRLINGLAEMKGEILLYKRGAMHGKNDEHYPIRLNDGKYAFVIGSINHILMYAKEQHDLLMNEGPSLLLFDLWAQEHLIDYDRLIGNPNFRTRAQYVWLMETYLVDNNEFFEWFNQYAHDNECLRAAYCVWKDGEIIRWTRAGANVHPKI